MPTYAIGDVQGCDRSLVDLLAHIEFDPERDHLWFAGDLVNRGPGSLGVLRRVMALGARAKVVLGNHDLHLLGRAAEVRADRPDDTFTAILAAPDREGLIDWVRTRPLMVEAEGWAMVHAGLLPEWTLAEGRAWARRIEAALGGPDWRRFLARMAAPKRDLTVDERACKQALAALTRIRMIRPNGKPDKRYKGGPRVAPAHLRPWYTDWRPPPGVRLLFGHWAMHDFARVPVGYALDSGCVWGGGLTALRLDDEVPFSVPTARGDRFTLWG